MHLKIGDTVLYKVGDMPHYIERKLTVIERDGRLALYGENNFFVWLDNAYGIINRVL